MIEKIVYNEAPSIDQTWYFGKFLGAHETTVNYEGVDLTLIVQDTQGQEEYLLATQAEYPRTRVFMVCFDINQVVQDRTYHVDKVGAFQCWL